MTGVQTCALPISSTGEGEMVVKKTGHFYGMTTHSRGGKFFVPNAKTVVDMGGLYVRAIKIDERGKVKIGRASCRERV